MTLAEYLAQSETSHAALAQKVGCTREYVTLITNGKRRPSLDIALKISKATGGKVTPQELSEAA